MFAGIKFRWTDVQNRLLTLYCILHTSHNDVCLSQIPMSWHVGHRSSQSWPTQKFRRGAPYGKGKVATVHRTISTGAHLSILGLWARRWYKPRRVWRMASARTDPAVTFLASEHHRPSTSTKLYCLVTEAYVYEHLPKVALDSAAAGIEPAISNHTSQKLTMYRSTIIVK